MSIISMTDNSPPLSLPRTHQIKREVLMMRILQNRIIGPLFKRFFNPQKILEQGMAFWSSRVVLTAVECGLFTELARNALSAQEVIERLGWQPRAAHPFLEVLVQMGLLRFDRAGLYSNSRQASLLLDRNKPSYVGGILELSSKRLYHLWSGLGNLLRSGKPEAEEETGKNEFFSALYRDPDALREFLSGMAGISTGEATLIASRFPWKQFHTFLDVGTALGALPVRLALTHRHLTGAGFDLPEVGALFKEYVTTFGLSDRLRFISGNMNEDTLPSADVICFGHLLHGHNELKRRDLISKAYAAIPTGGALLVYDAMISTGRNRNTMSLLSSLNIMIETREGFEATTDQCAGWFRDAGFVKVTTRHLFGPTSMVYGYKPKC